MLEGPPTPYRPTPHLINQFCTLHVGKVEDLSDPKRRGRARISCPGLLGDGEKNWTPWAPKLGDCVGSVKGSGDEGDWWPVQVGQCVLVGFVAGEPEAVYMIPGPAPADGEDPLMPGEVKSYKDPRKATRCRVRKSEAGHTLIMDDNGGSEMCGLLTWTGAGFAAYEPGKIEDEQETEGKESKPRKGVRREQKTVWEGTAGKPSELLKDGKGYYSWADLQGNGLYSVADDKAGGVVAVKVHKADGSVGCSFVMDAEKESVFISGGSTQVQVIGKGAKKVYFTSAIIWQAPVKAVKGYWEAAVNGLKGAMTKLAAGGKSTSNT